MNLYCGALSILTVGQTCGPGGSPRRAPAPWWRSSSSPSASRSRSSARGDFLANFYNFLLLLLCVLIPGRCQPRRLLPLRHGVYEIAGVVRTRRRPIRTLQLGGHRLLLHRHPGADPVPVDHHLHRVACKALGGVDISWIVGLAVIGPCTTCGCGPRFRIPTWYRPGCQGTRRSHDSGLRCRRRRTAGCVVASRLSEDPDVTVTVIEAGPSDEHEPRARDIRRWAEMLESEYDLDYRSVPQTRGNSGIRQARMRILGGCSTANTMITWRPLPADLDEWAALGVSGPGHPIDSRRLCPNTGAGCAGGRQGSQPLCRRRRRLRAAGVGPAR